MYTALFFVMKIAFNYGINEIVIYKKIYIAHIIY